jgi:DNA polymerase III alpha subunit
MYQRLPRTFDIPPAQPPGRPWPRPPAALPAAWLDRPPSGARITVAGLVLLRQRPGTAKGIVFVTLEDETGTVNVIVWKQVYEAFRRAVIAARLMRVTGRLQCEGPVTHVIAEQVEDISYMLDRLVAQDGASAALRPEQARAGDQPGRTYPDRRAPPPDFAD